LSCHHNEENTLRDNDLFEGFANRDPLAESVLDIACGVASMLTADEWRAEIAGTTVTHWSQR
jgi:hypothetical protein